MYLEILKKFVKKETFLKNLNATLKCRFDKEKW